MAAARQIVVEIAWLAEPAIGASIGRRQQPRAQAREPPANLHLIIGCREVGTRDIERARPQADVWLAEHRVIELVDGLDRSALRVRSEARRVGKEWVSKWRSRGWQYH